MNLASQLNHDTDQVSASTEARNETALTRFSVEGDSPEVFTNIYQEDVNIVTWQRELADDLTLAVANFIQANKKTRPAVLLVTPENVAEVMRESFGTSNEVAILSKDITLLVDMFCCLFDLKYAGLRLTVLEQAMCPSFHVDRIPCRLVTTYQGIATQWLPHNVIDRTKLGAGRQGKPDEKSGLFNDLNDIKQLNVGDVALLKGENWYDNEGAGLVHRSPAVGKNECRLLLTLDFIED